MGGVPSRQTLQTGCSGRGWLPPGVRALLLTLTRCSLTTHQASRFLEPGGAAGPGSPGQLHQLQPVGTGAGGRTLCSGGGGGVSGGCAQGQGHPADLPPASPVSPGPPCPRVSVRGTGRGPGSPSLGMESLCPPGQAVGLAFFSSMVATYRAGRLSQGDARRFVTGFLKAKAMSVSSRPKRGTGQCGHQGQGMLSLPCPGLLTLGGGHSKDCPTCCWTSWAGRGGLHPAWGGSRSGSRAGLTLLSEPGAQLEVKLRRESRAG